MGEEIEPKVIKDDVLSALQQVENIIELTANNEHKQFIYMHLNPVYYELQRQLTNLNDSASITKEKQKEQ